MSRSTISVAASVIIGIACVATISTDAFAYRRGVVASIALPHVVEWRRVLQQVPAPLLPEPITHHVAGTIPIRPATSIS